MHEANDTNVSMDRLALEMVGVFRAYIGTEDNLELLLKFTICIVIWFGLGNRQLILILLI
jgi:hypothetical protein